MIQSPPYVRLAALIYLFIPFHQDNISPNYNGSQCMSVDLNILPIRIYSDA